MSLARHNIYIFYTQSTYLKGIYFWKCFQVLGMIQGPKSVYDPWGKGQGQPRRDAVGNVQRFKQADPANGPYTDQVPATNQVG